MPPSQFPAEKGSTEHVEWVDQKGEVAIIEKLERTSSELSLEKDQQETKPPSSARDLVAEVLELSDDPTLSPWTFRMWFLGICLSLFASSV
jgi:hypothetical protein